VSFCVVMPYRDVAGYQRFREPCCLHLKFLATWRHNPGDHDFNDKNVIHIALQFWSVDPLDVFGPVVENGEGAFLKADPFYLMQTRQFYSVPWMAGFVTYEGNIRVAGEYFKAHIPVKLYACVTYFESNA